MTARQVFEATLIELSKIQAPSLKLYEFNYLFNKAINQYINKVYNVYDINQQTTDDLRVLKATAYLSPKKLDTSNSAIMGSGGISKAGYVYCSTVQQYNTLKGASLTQENFNQLTDQQKYVWVEGSSNKNGQATSYLSVAHPSIQSLHGATYEVYMPLDYLHMLNCVCIYYVAKQKDCWDAGSYIEIPATRLTADSWSQIVTDIYNRPSPMKPYYYIHNMNNNTSLPTNARSTSDVGTGLDEVGTDAANDYKVTEYDQNENSNFNRTFKLNGVEKSTVEKPIASRVGNASNVRCEIRYGKDDTLFQLVEVHVDYVKVPQFIRLTQEQIDLTEDTSQIMEFPDYVNQEIINELVHLVMERTADPRLQTNFQMTQSIARPTGQQQQPAQQQGQ